MADVLYVLGQPSVFSADQIEYERDVLCILHENLANLPITSAELVNQLRKNLNADISHADINSILEKLSAQEVLK